MNKTTFSAHSELDERMFFLIKDKIDAICWVQHLYWYYAINYLFNIFIVIHKVSVSISKSVSVSISKSVSVSISKNV